MRKECLKADNFTHTQGPIPVLAMFTCNKTETARWLCENNLEIPHPASMFASVSPSQRPGQLGSRSSHCQRFLFWKINNPVQWAMMRIAVAHFHPNCFNHAIFHAKPDAWKLHSCKEEQDLLTGVVCLFSSNKWLPEQEACSSFPSPHNYSQYKHFDASKDFPPSPCCSTSALW